MIYELNELKEKKGITKIRITDENAALPLMVITLKDITSVAWLHGSLIMGLRMNEVSVEEGSITKTLDYYAVKRREELSVAVYGNIVDALYVLNKFGYLSDSTYDSLMLGDDNNEIKNFIESNRSLVLKTDSYKSMVKDEKEILENYNNTIDKQHENEIQKQNSDRPTNLYNSIDTLEVDPILPSNQFFSEFSNG